MSTPVRFSAFLVILLGHTICHPSHRRVLNKNEGERCMVEELSMHGICKRIDQCISVLRNKINHQPVTVCSYSNRMEVVCCPEPLEHSTTTTLAPLIDNSISARKCMEYRSAVLDLATLSESDKLSGPFRPVCSYGRPYIIAGVETLQGEFPHMALIVYNNNDEYEIRCGGSLISELYVLTVGHCLNSQGEGAPTHVKLGVHNVSPNDTVHDPYGIQSKTFAIAEIIRHPRYSRTSAFDIGLIRLVGPVEFNAYMHPACLPGRQFQVDERTSLTATGWGVTNFETKQQSQNLQKVSLEMFAASECETLLQGRRAVWNAQNYICAGSRTDARDSCQGDSGGPLQIEQQPEQEHCMYMVLGLVAAGMGCGGPNRPSIYMRVQAFLPWIEQVVWSS